MIPTCVLKVRVKFPPRIVLDADLLAPPAMDSGILAGLDSGFLAPLGSSWALLGAPGLSWELLGSPVSFSAFLSSYALLGVLEHDGGRPNTTDPPGFF